MSIKGLSGEGFGVKGSTGGSHVIVLGNEKGGSGKSTTAVHIAVTLAVCGSRVAVVDLDHRQKTTARYFENRVAWSRKHDLNLPMVDVRVLEDGQEDALEGMLQEGYDAIVIDTPGRDSSAARAAITLSDTLVTPINDSFIDFDLLGQVDAESYKVTRPSFYAELVWKARQMRARKDGATVDWVVIRNRLASLEARNRKRVGGALDELSRRVGFRVAPGLSERVIYRELFPRGLTLQDMAHVSEASMSHVAARAELRELMSALQLPLSITPQEAAA